MRTLCIISPVADPPTGPYSETWGINRGISRSDHKLTRLYFMDPPDCFGMDAGWFIDMCQQRHREGVRIIHEQEIDIFRCERYPREMAFELTGRTHFGSTVSYMLAHAIIERFDEITLWGILSGDETYEYQRPALEYWCGVAEGRGIRIKTGGGTGVLTPCMPRQRVFTDGEGRERPWCEIEGVDPL